MRRRPLLLSSVVLLALAASCPSAPVVIEGVPKMDWSTGRFSLHISALYGALQTMGCPTAYDELMVASGAAFRIAWLPGRYHYGAPEVSPEDLVINAAEAAGAYAERVQHASPEEAWQTLCESLNEGRPALCWREWGLAVICGYDPQGGRVYLQEYQNTGPGYTVMPFNLQKPPWPYKGANEITLLEYDPNVTPPELDWPTILDRVVRWADWPVEDKLFKQYAFGLAAYDAWAQTLRGGMDNSGAETDAILTEFTARVMADARSAASVVLQEYATLHDAFAEAATHYMNEAELFKSMAPVLSQGETGTWAKTTAAMKANFADEDVREEAAQLIEQAKEEEALAVDALREALADLAEAPAEAIEAVPPEEVTTDDPNATEQPAAEPDETTKRDPEKAKQLVQLAKQAKQKKGYKEADGLLREAIEADPLNVEAHWVRAWVLIELKQTDDAAAEFRKVIALDPDSDLATQAKKALERLGG